MELEAYVEGGVELMLARENMIEAVVWRLYTEWIDTAIAVCLVAALLATLRAVVGGAMHMYKRHVYNKKVDKNDKRLY